MRARNLVRRSHRRFLPLPPGPVVLLIASICLAFGSGPAPAVAADLAGHGPEAEVPEVRDNRFEPGLSGTSEPALRARPAVTEDSAAPTCSQWISSCPNDPPMLGMLILAQWDPVLQIYIGVYAMEGGDQPFRKFRCDTYEELV